MIRKLLKSPFLFRHEQNISSPQPQKDPSFAKEIHQQAASLKTLEVKKEALKDLKSISEESKQIFNKNINKIYKVAEKRFKKAKKEEKKEQIYQEALIGFIDLLIELQDPSLDQKISEFSKEILKGMEGDLGEKELKAWSKEYLKAGSDLIKKISRKAAGEDEETKNKIKTAKETALTSLKEKIDAYDKKGFTDTRSIKKRGKELTKELEEINTQAALEFIKNLKEQGIDVQGLKAIQADALSHLNKKKLLRARKRKIWDPNKRFDSTMQIGRFKVTSSFQAVGPAYSSQAPRNRTAKKAALPNFFRSELEVAGKKIAGFTRSAITVEFGQKNAKKREAANLELVKQVMEAASKAQLEKLTKEDRNKLLKQQNPEITLNMQTVNLLSPDLVRSLTHQKRLGKIFGRFVRRLAGSAADDERFLALENLAAHEALNGKELFIDYNGKKVKVIPQLRYFNFPCNKLAEKLPKKLLETKKLEEANQASWEGLKLEAEEAVSKLEKDFKLNSHKEIDELSQKKKELRQQILEETLKAGKPANQAFFKDWQKTGDELARKIGEIQDKTLRERLALREQLNDLALDTDELFRSGFGTRFKHLDNNRFALASRVIALGVLIDQIEVHIGCRSGKDRTGLADSEVKLLLFLGEKLGRIPSYREMEKIRGISFYRTIMILRSGNFSKLVKGQMGASIGANIGGARIKPRRGMDPDEARLHELAMKRAQGISNIARLPKTQKGIPAGYKKVSKKKLSSVKEK